jgi:ribosomal protein S18 acetylase RimI-like enzyme
MKIEIIARPQGPEVAQILAIVDQLSAAFFTDDVLPATRFDLLFQDVVCAKTHDKPHGEVRAFIMFTSLDGAIHLSLMGVHPQCRRQGYGTALIRHLELHALELGFDQLVVFTVPPDKKPAFQSTMNFYLKCGFRLTKRYTELWQSGALELRKKLSKDL